MPIYEYECKQCGNAFEVLVRPDTVPACPACQSGELEKRLSLFATASRPEPAPAGPGPCGSCGNFRGPGSCMLN